MAHPYAAYRQTKKEHSRVGHITKKYASGGGVHADAAQDKALIRKMVKKKDLSAEGEKSKHRMDRPKRAKGGKVHSNGKTIINVIAGGHPAGGAVPPMPAGPPMGVAPAAMAPPPMAAKPPMMPPPGGGGPPPMPMRAKGGKVRRRDDGGAVDKYPNRVPGVTDEEIERNAARRPPGDDGGERQRAKGGKVKRRAEGGSADKPLPTTKDFDDILQSNPQLYKALGGYGPKIPRRASGGGLPNPFDDSSDPTPIPAGPFDDIKAKKIKVPKRTVGLPPNEYAKGGAVKSIGMNVGTKVQHTDGKDDQKDIGRGRVVSFQTGGGVRSFRAYGGRCDGPPQTPTRAKGGRVESPQGVAPATRLPGGAGGGEARLTKEHRAERKR